MHLGNGAVENLLQMQSGIGFPETYSTLGDGPLRLLFAEPDSAAYAASFPQETPSGSAFNYSTANYNLLQDMLRSDDLRAQCAPRC